MTITQKIPTDLKKALNTSSKVKTLWDSLTPIAHRDFIRWVETSGKPETRKIRIQKTISKILSGHRRPCCYAIMPMNLYKALGEVPKAKQTWSTLSADEKRDFVEWMEDVKDKDARVNRINKILMTLSSGKRKP